VAVIKRKLQLLLPQCRIFLDIDDLDDIDHLERYVKMSQAILIFLSKGYFSSENCLREFRCATENNISLILVHEHDVSKGGVSLDVLREDCILQGQSAAVLTDNALEIIKWYRAAEFQALTLKMVASNMLHATPLFSSQARAPSLLLPGEIRVEYLEFRKEVVVFVSDCNPGAVTLVEQFAGHCKDENLHIVHKFAESTRRPTKTLDGLMSTLGLKTKATTSSKSIFQSPDGKAHRTVGNIGRQASINLTSSVSYQIKKSANMAASRSSELSRKPKNDENLPERLKNPTHMLVYLNSSTFEGSDGKTVASLLRAARFGGLEIILAHENDARRGACPFSRFFETTPDDLIRDGLYKKMAVALHPGPHYMVSLAMLGKSLGAVQRGKLGRYLSKVSTNASRAGNLSSIRTSSQRISLKKYYSNRCSCSVSVSGTQSLESLHSIATPVSNSESGSRPPNAGAGAGVAPIV